MEKQPNLVLIILSILSGINRALCACLVQPLLILLLHLRKFLVHVHRHYGNLLFVLVSFSLIPDDHLVELILQGQFFATIFRFLL